MSPVDRSPGDRPMPSVGSALRSVGRLASGVHRREDEILRQLTDVFSELTKLSAQVYGGTGRSRRHERQARASGERRRYRDRDPCPDHATTRPAARVGSRSPRGPRGGHERLGMSGADQPSGRGASGPVVVDLRVLQSPVSRASLQVRLALEIADGLERHCPDLVSRYLLAADWPPPGEIGDLLRHGQGRLRRDRGRGPRRGAGLSQPLLQRSSCRDGQAVAGDRGGRGPVLLRRRPLPRPRQRRASWLQMAQPAPRLPVDRPRSPRAAPRPRSVGAAPGGHLRGTTSRRRRARHLRAGRLGAGGDRSRRRAG